MMRRNQIRQKLRLKSFKKSQENPFRMQMENMPMIAKETLSTKSTSRTVSIETENGSSLNLRLENGATSEAKKELTEYQLKYQKLKENDEKYQYRLAKNREYGAISRARRKANPEA